ncbi:CinA family protein [Aquabacterium sp. A08]|uniref:CinA family protein n=1 Tax=Aquabacterium sp. A08 TaxID=2718532 RepID=UPI0014204DD6|nr:CinA family protein [Aquabacterium sp. A08]NIC41346.1 CinA family protein [Aquabacterium sp. A08]NIC41349.1 CinA family protein [Aquabacterium sp. A08]
MSDLPTPDASAPPLWLLPATWPLLVALAERLKAQGARLATAESCTGGLIAASCTALSGSSDWFEQGWVTYSNAAKSAQLGVPAALIAAHGAVSEPVARAMACGARDRAGVRHSVAVTGVAGPTGGSPDKPVGTVWFGWCDGQRVWTERRVFPGDRAAVRAATVQHALAGVLATPDRP